jgi:heme A synthase
MENTILGLAGFGLLLFIVGLAGKIITLKQKSMKSIEFFHRMTVFSLILILLCALIYALIKLI